MFVICHLRYIHLPAFDRCPFLYLPNQKSYHNSSSDQDKSYKEDVINVVVICDLYLIGLCPVFYIMTVYSSLCVCVSPVKHVIIVIHFVRELSRESRDNCMIYTLP